MRTQIQLRNYHRSDRAGLFKLLFFLPSLYPKSDEWLDRKLYDVEDRKARCTVVTRQQLVFGVLIDTPKGRRTSKISTIYLRPELSGFGTGRLLLERHRAAWWQDVDSVYVTVSRERRASIDRFLVANKFSAVAVAFGRYGEGRDELIYKLQNS